MSYAQISPQSLIDNDHMVGSLFVKECRPLNLTQLTTPILMVHGSNHGWWAWRVWQPFFATAGWPTYALSLRGHYGSEPVQERDFLNLTMSDYVEDVASISRWLGRAPILMGHSLGGIVVQKAAETVNSAAIALIASIGPSAIGKQRPGPPPPIDKVVLPDKAEALNRWMHDPWPEDRFNEFYECLTPESPGVLATSGTGLTDVNPDLIKCPILCVGGKEDKSYVPKAEKLAQIYGADWFEQPDAGHDMMLESAAIDVAQRINHWLIDRLGLDRSPRVETARSYQ